MTRRVGIVAFVFVGVVAAVYLQTRSTDRSVAHALGRSWQSVGGTVVNPHLDGDSSDGVLSCFRFRFGLNRTDLCFDARNRLVERLEVAQDKASVTDVLVDPERSPVTLSPAAMTRAVRVSDEIGTLGKAELAARSAFAECATTIRSAVNTFHGRVPKAEKAALARLTKTARERLFGKAFRVVDVECLSAATTLSKVRELQRTFGPVAAAVGRLELTARRAHLLTLSFIRTHGAEGDTLALVKSEQRIVMKAQEQLAEIQRQVQLSRQKLLG